MGYIVISVKNKGIHRKDGCSMSKMRRQVSKYYNHFFIIAIVCILFLTGGCKPAAPKQQEAELDTVTLFSDVDFWDLPDWSLEEGSVSAEISKQTGLVIENMIPPQDALRILSSLFLKEELPDVIVLSDENMVHQLAVSGKVWDLQELLERYCPESHLLKRFPEDMKQELIRRDGAWYAYPSHINSLDAKEIWQCSGNYYDKVDQYSTTLAVIWNRRLLEEFGLTAQDLQTKKQVFAAFDKVKAANQTIENGQIVPLLLDGSLYQDYSLTVLNNCFGAECVDSEGNYRERWLSPEAKETLLFVNTALREEYAYAKDLMANNTKIKADMASGNVLCFIGNEANTGIDPSEWISFGPILSESGKRPVLGKDIRMAKGWLNTLVSKSCKNPQKVAKWLDYMTSNQGMLVNNYGFEGEDYVWEQDGTIRLTKEGIEKRADYAVTGYSAWWNFGNYAWERSILPLPKEDEDSYQTHLLESALGSYSDTYIYDTTLLSLPNNYIDPESELGQIQQQISAFTESQIAKIIAAGTEQEFEESYAYFLSHLKELGIEKLDLKINEQVQKNYVFYGDSIKKVN